MIDIKVNDFVKIKGRYNNYHWYKVVSIEQGNYFCKNLREDPIIGPVILTIDLILEIKTEEQFISLYKKVYQ